MEFSEKMTAALIAAILIAIAGVMPALAIDEDSVNLIAEVIPTLLYISVPETVTFGEVQRGAQAMVLIDIETGGEPLNTVDLTASLVDDQYLFYDSLTLNGQEVLVYREEEVALGPYFITLEFTVPPDALYGPHSGTLTIYVEYHP